MSKDTALIEKPDTVPAPSIEVSESSFDALISKAIDQNVSPETMEKFLAMRRELKAEAAKEAFFKALAEFQAECPVIVKGRSVLDKNDKLRYKYAPIDKIITVAGPLLKKNGFSYTLHPRPEENAQVAVCTLHHIAGHAESSEFKSPIDSQAYMNAPQKYASAYTYASRYAFCAVTGILTGSEDDDAQGAGDPQPKAQPPQDKSPTSNHPAEWQELYDAMLVMMDDNDFYGDVKDSEGRVMHLDGLKKGLASITADMSIDSMKRTYDSYKLLLDTAKKQHDTNNQ